MENKVTVTLPKLGESIVGATVVQWLKKVGDTVRLDEALVEVSTDKVNSEIPSPVSGVLVEILAAQDAEIEVGAPLAVIATTGTAHSAASFETKEVKQESTTGGREEVFSPSVLRIASASGLSLDLLKTIKGTGEGGRVTKKDIEEFVADKKPKQGCPALRNVLR